VNEERLGSLEQFATQLATHLAAFAEPGSPLPSDAELAALVDATFFASLHEEEARRIEFSIAWQPGAQDCVAVVAITPPVRATPKNLAKLAPATWHEATSIAVRHDGTELVAWALLERNASAHQPLTIRVLAPGVLRVDYIGAPTALYARGEILLRGGAHDVKSPALRLTRAFPAWSAGADASTGIDFRALAVARVAARSLAHGHGGMILVIPAEVATPSGVRVHYGVADGASVLVRRFAEVVRDVAVEDRLARLTGSRTRDASGRIAVRDEAQIAFAEAIELVARLTAIDNALLVDTNLELRGFGVQVIEGDTPHLSFEHVSPYSEDVHVDDLSTFKGTRHPAGVIFCMRQDSAAAAIIASQDGHLSLATKDARGGVEVLGSYQHAFGWR
jgi:hypothetical protein